MENASKALLMAAEILMGLIILTIGVYLTVNYTKISGTYSSKMETEQIQDFNKNYLKYEGRTDITAQEIISIINFTKEHNKEHDDNPQYKIKVFIDGIDSTNKSNEDLVNILKQDLDSINITDLRTNTYYTCRNRNRDRIFFNRTSRRNKYNKIC